MTIGGSIALIVTGAILRYAVNWSFAHVNVPLIGLILMVGGAIGLIISLVFLMRRRTSAPSEEVYQQRRYTEAPGRTLSLRIVTPSLWAAPPSRRPDHEVGGPGAFLPDRFCLRAGQLGKHQVLEEIELPVEVQRRRCW